MASSRKTGTNEQISTYDSAGGKDYSSLSTWEAATGNDLVGDTESEVLEVYNGPHDDAVDINGAITNASYFRIIRPAVGHFHDGTPNNGTSFFVSTHNDPFSIIEDYCQVQDIIAGHDLNESGNNACFKMDEGCTQAAYVGCIAMGDGNVGSGETYGFELQADTGEDNFVINCIAINCTSHGFEMVGAGEAWAYNCTAVNGDTDGFLETAGTFMLKNCLSSGNTGDDFNNVHVLDYLNCASSDATALGTGKRINQTFTFVNSGNDDYHLASGDAGAKDYGTDLSADGDYAFDDDIDFDTRVTSWDIGFDHVVVGPVNLADLDGVLKASINDVNGVVIASINDINDVD